MRMASRTFGNRAMALVAALGIALGGVAAPTLAGAQSIETVDPDAPIDGDLLGEPGPAQDGPDAPIPGDPGTAAYPYDIGTVDPDAVTYDDYDDTTADTEVQASVDAWTTDDVNGQTADASAAATRAATQETPGDTYGEDDLIGAAEGVFGKGAEGLARLNEDLLEEQGEPNGYIVGREGGGAFILGVRYGSGTLYHKVEGQRKVYWTGPSIGFDIGANAASTFVLVYNLYDTEELYQRFPAGEGQAYFVGGLTVSYLRSGDTVLIPIRTGAGLRLGINAGYMKFSKKQKWSPF